MGRESTSLKQNPKLTLTSKSIPCVKSLLNPINKAGMVRHEKYLTLVFLLETYNRELNFVP